jgi:hypothetical protein
VVPELAKYASTLEQTPAWVAVSASERCPCCGARDGCTLRADRDFARCYGVVSSLPILGGGWLHAIADESDLTPWERNGA